MHETALDRVQTMLRGLLYALTVGVYAAFAGLVVLVFFGFVAAIVAG